MEPHVAVAHLALELGSGHQRRNGVDHEHVDGAGAHEGVRDLERLLAGIGLRDQELVDIDAELLGVAGVEGMLGVDEGTGAAVLLGLRDHVERQRGLAGALGTVDLDDAAARQPADAQCDVEAERSRGDHLRLARRRLAGAQAHDRALAEGPLDLAQRRVQRLLLVHIVLFDDP